MDTCGESDWIGLIYCEPLISFDRKIPFDCWFYSINCLWIKHYLLLALLILIIFSSIQSEVFKQPREQRFFEDNTLQSLQQKELSNKSFGFLIGFWSLVSPQLEIFQRQKYKILLWRSWMGSLVKKGVIRIISIRLSQEFSETWNKCSKLAAFHADQVEEHVDNSANEITSVVERRRSREFEQLRQIIPEEGYFRRQSVIFLGTRVLTERNGGSIRGNKSKRLHRQRRDKELRSFAAENEATEEQAE